MKKTGLLILGLIAMAVWANAHRNELAVWFNSDSFYRPIFSRDFDVLQSGSTVRAELTPSYDVRHGFFLTFPCNDVMSTKYANMDGSIHYSLYADGVELQSETLAVPKRPMMGLSSSGICDILLFTFDLPFKGSSPVTLEVVVDSPIAALAPHRNDVKCEVSPAYWPK